MCTVKSVGIYQQRDSLQPLLGNMTVMKRKKKNIHRFQHLFLKLKYLHYEDMVFSIPVENRHAYVYTDISTFTQIASYSHCPLTILIKQVQGASNRCVQLGPTWGPSAVAAAPPKAGSLPQALKTTVLWHGTHMPSFSSLLFRGHMMASTAHGACVGVQLSTDSFSD